MKLWKMEPDEMIEAMTGCIVLVAALFGLSILAAFAVWAWKQALA